MAMLWWAVMCVVSDVWGAEEQGADKSKGLHMIMLGWALVTAGVGGPKETLCCGVGQVMHAA